MPCSCCFLFILSEVLEEDVVKNESDDELEGLAALFLEHERKPAVRIRGHLEEVVANLSDDRFKRKFFFTPAVITNHAINHASSSY